MSSWLSTQPYRASFSLSNVVLGTTGWGDVHRPEISCCVVIAVVGGGGVLFCVCSPPRNGLLRMLLLLVVVVVLFCICSPPREGLLRRLLLLLLFFSFCCRCCSRISSSPYCNLSTVVRGHKTSPNACRVENIEAKSRK